MNIGVICEYNPFHNGHLYHIQKIREQFGEDTNIVALMSGNYVQRGGVAIADKGLRSKCAVLSGVNLVLEIPFPFSMSSAEYFAKSAVHILNNLGCIDYISFGSESGCISSLINTAELMLTDDFLQHMKTGLADPNLKKLGHAALCETVLKKLDNGNKKIVDLTPNNILAIEYIKAVINSNSAIKLHTVKRLGNSFSDEHIVSGNIQSATAIRNAIEKNDISALEFIPNITKKVFLAAIATGDFPCDSEQISSAVIASFRLSSPLCQDKVHDTSGGLYNRLKQMSFKTNTIEGLICAAESKKFTRSRIRRAIFYSLLGVTSSLLNEMPAYTQLLGFDSNGRAMLKTIGKQSRFPILTKPSDIEKLPDSAVPQKTLSDMADSVFEMTKPIPKDGNVGLRFTPFVKK